RRDVHRERVFLLEAVCSSLCLEWTCCERYLEGRFKVSVWRVLCDSWSQLVSLLVSYCRSFAFFFLWIYYDVPCLFGHSWLYPFRSIFDLLLLRLREEICQIDTISELHLRQKGGYISFCDFFLVPSAVTLVFLVNRFFNLLLLLSL